MPGLPGRNKKKGNLEDVTKQSKRGMHKRRRHSRRSNVVHMSKEASVIAREATKALKVNRFKTDLAQLVTQGILDPQAATNMFNMYRGRDDAGNRVYYKPRRVRGYGAYSIGNAIGEAGKLVGAYARGGVAGVGGQLMHDVARAGGTTQRRGIYDWVGSGAYHSANQLVNPGGASSIFRSHVDETNDVIISHREYIMDITPSTSNFQTIYTAFQNPGLAQSFPWLSQLAQFFEEYEFEQLLYTVESMVTEGNTNAAGTVMMCTQYNPTNAPFTQKQTMENYEHSQSFKVTQHAVHGVESDYHKKAGTKAEYIRTGPVPQGQDPKTFDLGVFQLATQGAYPMLNIGELWVTYTVRLSKAKIPPVGSMNLTPLMMTGGSFGNVNTSSLPEMDFFGIIAQGSSPNAFYSCFGTPGLNPNGFDNSNPNGLDGTGFQVAFCDNSGSGVFLSPNGNKSTLIQWPFQCETGVYRVRFGGSLNHQPLTSAPIWQCVNGNIVNVYQTQGQDVTAFSCTVIISVASPGNSNACELYWDWPDLTGVYLSNQFVTITQLPFDYGGLL